MGGKADNSRQPPTRQVIRSHRRADPLFVRTTQSTEAHLLLPESTAAPLDEAGRLYKDQKMQQRIRRT
jgi:hypothetical protein